MDRLETLKSLFEKNFISQAEYEARKRQIIDDLTKTSFATTPASPYDEEEGFGSNRHEKTKSLSQIEEEEEENFGPKKSAKSVILGSSLFPTPLPLKVIGADTTTSSSSTSQAVKLENISDTDRGEMDISEKYALSRQISTLPGTCLRVILEIVKDSSPDDLERSGEDWVFDLKTLSSETLWKLHDYVEAWNKEDNKEKGSQGEEKQVLAATVISTQGEERTTNTPTDVGGRGLKRPRVTPLVSPEKPEKLEKPKRLARAVKKSKVAVFSSDEENEEENEMEPAGEMEVKEKEQQQTQSDSSMEEKEPRERRGEPFKIQVCIYSLSKKNASARPYICDACGKSFKDRSNLSQHLRVHTKEKPYVCSFDGCRKNFAHSASLKEHMNAHVGIKPHICDFPGCGQSFAQASNLRRHQRGVHTGERPFECTYYGCGKKFAQNSNLKQHMEKVHSIRKGDDDHIQILR